QGASGVLPTCVPAPAAVPAASLSDAHQAALPDGRRLSETARQGISALSAVPLHRGGAANAVRAQSQPVIPGARPAGTSARAGPDFADRLVRVGARSHQAHLCRSPLPQAKNPPRSRSLCHTGVFAGKNPPITLKK